MTLVDSSILSLFKCEIRFLTRCIDYFSALNLTNNIKSLAIARTADCEYKADLNLKL